MHTLALPLVLGACRDAGSPAQPTPEPIAPAAACAGAVPIGGSAGTGTTSYIVAFQEGVEPADETARLAQKYAFVPTNIYTVALRGFAATLSSAALAGIRCETTVSGVTYDARTFAF